MTVLYGDDLEQWVRQISVDTATAIITGLDRCTWALALPGHPAPMPCLIHPDAHRIVFGVAYHRTGDVFGSLVVDFTADCRYAVTTDPGRLELPAPPATTGGEGR